ncbi:MAG: BrnT family toxin [Acidobacteria bacterium]|nr:BrnT family toxin [Acidobacteriota bacterium]
MQFDWDPDKAARNLKDHQISFEEAQTVFDDTFNIEFYDPEHSDDEHRFIVVGRSRSGRLLLISFTERGEMIRIISARVATPKESRDYGNERFE